MSPTIQRTDSAQPRRLGVDTCPGTTEYGRGLSLTTVHSGGCCERFEAARPAAAFPLPLRPCPPKPGYLVPRGLR